MKERAKRRKEAQVMELRLKRKRLKVLLNRKKEVMRLNHRKVRRKVKEPRK